MCYHCATMAPTHLWFVNLNPDPENMVEILIVCLYLSITVKRRVQVRLENVCLVHRMRLIKRLS